MRKSLILAVAFAFTVATALSANAYPYGIGSPVRASGPSPFLGCTAADNGTDVNFPNSEVEPFVAVNPTDPNNLVGVYQQDKYHLGASKGLVAAYSFDGGASWGHSYAPLSACAGGDPAYPQASDPWVTFDSDGNVYQSGLAFSNDFNVSTVRVSKSIDGGITWGPAATLIRDDETTTVAFNDKDSITGDPGRPGYVYAVWDRIRATSANMSQNGQANNAAYRGTPMFSRTTDGGSTWSAPAAMTTTNKNFGTIANAIVVLPNGDLVDVFRALNGSGIQPSPNQHYQGVMISKDAGLHWSSPIKVANEASVPVIDPDTGAHVRAGTGLPSIAVDPNRGALYVVWTEGSFSGGDHDDIALSISTDGGHGWSAPVKVNQSPAGVAAFSPAVAVTSDGTVAITYYDLRSNTPDSSTLPTDVWLVHSHDRGQTWGAEQHLDGPFDEDLAPVCGGVFLGDYQGLAAAGADVVAFDATTDGETAPGTSDVFLIRAVAP